MTLHSRLRRRAVPVLALLLTGAALAVGARRAPAPPLADEPVLVPHLLDAVRVPGRVGGQVLFVNPSDAPRTPLALRLLTDGLLLHAEDLAAVPVPGGPRFAAALAKIERLPAEYVERRAPRVFSDPAAPPLAGEAARLAAESAGREIAALREAWAAGEPPPFREVNFPVDLDQVFGPDTARGATAELRVELDWTTGAGVQGTAVAIGTVEFLGPRATLPETFALGSGLVARPGDLHVHSCHGEAVNACAPSANCAAESFQTSGSFTYAQLKSQYQALGIEWMTATDHSYCIDSPGEYQTVAAECAALTDGAFLALPDTELSSDEVGPQTGGDTGDLVCLFSGGSNHNHMGAHGVSSWLYGGSEGFLGWCGSNALEDFTANVATVRAQGGWAIANHPTAGSFAWNSFSGTAGLEGDGLQGVEIWNGAAVSGQGGAVARWVDWLLAGRVLYAYSGSDTHDQAFDFGANQALLPAGVLNAGALTKALKSGRSYISRSHALVVEAAAGGQTFGMGALATLPQSQPAGPMDVDVHYNFGADTGVVTVFRGRVGDASETVLATSGPLTGQGTFSTSGALELGTRSWVRAYAEAAGEASYTNPVFFLPGGPDVVTYGLGVGGANVGLLDSPSSPALGTSLQLELSGLANSTAAVLAFSGSKQDPGLPLLGGTLLLGLPVIADFTLPLSGGATQLVLPIPSQPGLVGQSLYWQAVAVDFTQPAFLAFTNGLETTFGPPAW